MHCYNQSEWALFSSSNCMHCYNQSEWALSSSTNCMFSGCTTDYMVRRGWWGIFRRGLIEEADEESSEED